MSDTVKLIIEIDKRAYKACQELRTNNDDGIVGLCAVNAIANGTLLDDVKAEIAEEICLTDNPYTKETKYTIEHLKLLEILDNIGKAESEENECEKNT